MGERYTHAAMLRGMQAKFPQEASTSQLYHLAQGVAPVWTVDAVSDIILLWPKTRAAYLKYLPARCRHYRTQGRAHRFGIILIQKDSFKGIGPST